MSIICSHGLTLSMLLQFVLIHHWHLHRQTYCQWWDTGSRLCSYLIHTQSVFICHSHTRYTEHTCMMTFHLVLVLLCLMLTLFLEHMISSYQLSESCSPSLGHCVCVVRESDVLCVLDKAAIGWLHHLNSLQQASKKEPLIATWPANYCPFITPDTAPHWSADRGRDWMS